MPQKMMPPSSASYASFGNKLHRIASDLASNAELRDSVIVLGLSGTIAMYLYTACKEHDVKQFYAQHDSTKMMVILFGACSFVIWFSVAVNIKFVAFWLFRNIFIL
jgi:hypothetical protein